MSSQFSIYAVKRGEKIDSNSFMVKYLTTTPTRELHAEGLIDYTFDNENVYRTFTSQMAEDIAAFYKRQADWYKNTNEKKTADISILTADRSNTNSSQMYEYLTERISEIADLICDNEEEEAMYRALQNDFYFVATTIETNRNYDFYYSAD